MAAIDILLRLVGVFYVFAGYALARSTLAEHFLDEALAALVLEKPDSASKARQLLFLCFAVLVFSGGMMLILLLDAAAWIFLAASLLQALWLSWIGPRYLDALEPPDAQGRRRTINAFVLYAVVTAFVLWAWHQERLLVWHDVPWPLLAIAAATIVVFCGYLVWSWARLRPESST